MILFGYQQQRGPGRPRAQLEGRKVGSLTVIARAADAVDGRTRWLCRCACGTMVVVRTANLRDRHRPVTCGCAQRRVTRRPWWTS